VSLARSRFLRKLRIAFFFTTLFGLFLAIVTLVWLNSIGMPQAWRTALESKLAQNGIFVRVQRLSYIPWSGIVAENICLYSSIGYDEELANLEHLVFDIDKTKALRNIHQLTKLEIENADILIPISSESGNPEYLKIEDLSGKIRITRDRKFELRRAQGVIAGIKLVIDAEVVGWKPSNKSNSEEKSDFKVRQLLQDIVKELSLWQWDEQLPPEIQIKLQADINKWNALRASIDFSSKELKRGDLELHDVLATGNISRSVLSISQCTASDKNGKLQTAFDYDLYKRSGHFQCDSTLDVLHIARVFSPQPLVPEIALISPPHLVFDGSFDLTQPAFGIQATGTAACKTSQYRSHLLDDLKLDFSYHQGDIYLRDVSLTHAQGSLNFSVMMKDQSLRARATGALPMDLLRPLIKHPVLAPAIENLETTGLQQCKATAEAHINLGPSTSLHSLVIKDLELTHKQGWLKGSANLSGNLVDYAIESTLPPAIGQPFFVGQPLAQVLASFTPVGKAETYVKLAGKSDITNIYAWHVTGNASIKNTAYRGVPVYQAACNMDLSHPALRFSQIAVDFDYSDYPLRKKYNADTHGPVTAVSVNWIHEHGHVAIDSVSGTLYPAPLLRMFAREAADHLEDYLFHQVPKLTASGIVDVRHQKNTKINIAIQRADAMTWTLIGQPTVFRDVSSKVVVSDDSVLINPLKCKLFDGDTTAAITVGIKAENAFTVETSWNDFSMEEIAKTHEFKEKGYGRLTGRIKIKGDKNGTNTLTGDGQSTLVNGELFAVPIFGPLSPLIAGIVGDRRVGFERAENASATFTIKKGLLEFADFKTATGNLKFTGNGICDLDKKTLDMTIRMNARGLLGFLTFPLSPIIKGLFQFQGTGPLANTTWNHVVFTSPPEQEKKALLDSKTPKD
jgi:AsmA-like C-terminal region